MNFSESVENIIFSFLFRRKYKVPSLSEKEQDLVIKLADKNMISGFILNSCDFNHKHTLLVDGLRQLWKRQVMTSLSQKVDFLRIAKLFNKQGIKFDVLKGWKLKMLGVYDDGCRYSRDIDLLVESCIPI